MIRIIITALFAIGVAASAVAQGTADTSPTLAAVPYANDADRQQRVLAARMLADIVTPSDEAAREVYRSGIRTVLDEVRSEPEVVVAMRQDETLLPELEKRLFAAYDILDEEEGDSYEVGLAAIYERYLSTQDIRSLVDFFSSATGKKVMAAMHAGIDIGAFMNDEPVTADTFEELKRDQIAILMGSITPDDIAYVKSSGHLTALLEARKLGPLISEYDARYMNTPSPKFDAALDRIFGDFYEAIDALQ